MSESKSILATVSAFRPTMHGFQVETNKGTHYVSKQLFPNGIEVGVQIKYTEHKAGEAYPKHFGTEGVFKKDGIHDIMITRSVAQANIAFKATLSLVTEEA